MVQPGATASLETAIAHHRAGRLEQAALAYERVLSAEPEHEQALFLLGALHLGSRRTHEAVDLLRRALEKNPSHPGYLSNLGEAYRRAGRLREAADTLVKAVALKPDLAEASFNLGLAMSDLGEPESALICFIRAADLLPERFELQFKLAESLKGRGDFLRAVAHYQAALAREPRSLEALLGLSESQSRLGRHAGAVATARRAVALAPQAASAQAASGRALAGRGRDGDLDESIACCRRALALDASSFDAHFLLAGGLLQRGELGESLEHFRRALAIDPENHTVHSNIVYLTAFDANATPQALLDEARAWSRIHAEPLANEIRTSTNDPSPERRLRVGYVGAGFGDHCQAFFLEPLLAHHDHERFEIHCYANVRPDAVTERLKRRADAWRDIVGERDADVANLIRDDGIDVLVDLTMHMANSRLRVFARKPAPIQICWLAYPGTTGLGTMDYRVTDPLLDPPGAAHARYSEKPLLLEDAFWCYDPLDQGTEVTPLPALANGHVTFGCLNTFWKLNEGTLSTWARVLRAVERSRLVVLTPDGVARERLLAGFERAGVERGRIDCVPRRPRPDYLRSYQGIDVCLDSFPCNGHTTSLDAFWMGVPVVTMVGDRVVGRAGLCQATLLGLPELVGHDEDDFVQAALGLSANLDALAELRGGLRSRLQRSPLMDGARFARNLEAAYRRAWHSWCESAEARTSR